MAHLKVLKSYRREQSFHHFGLSLVYKKVFFLVENIDNTRALERFE